MKSLVTAVGMDQINEIFRRQGTINVLDIDIQSQEVLWSRLKDDEIKSSDYLLITELLKGPFSKQEMIKEVQNRFEGKIYVILKEPGDESYINFLRSIKITNIFSGEDDIQELIDAIVYDGVVEIEEENKPLENLSADERHSNKIYLQKQTVAVVGVGGAGKTTVALALGNEMAKRNYKVCILDLNFEKADIGSYAGVEEKGIQELLRGEVTELNIMDQVTSKKNVNYFTGLRNLMEIQTALDLVRITIKVLKKHHDVLIIDTGNFTNPATHISISMSESQIFVTRNSETAVKATRRYLDLYNKNIGMILNAVAVVNQAQETDLGDEEIENILDINVPVFIKNDSKIFCEMEKGKILEKYEADFTTLRETIFKLEELHKRKKSLWPFSWKGRR